MSGRYTLGKKLATGGMAEIFQARVRGAGGFEKDVVVKRILPHFAEDAGFRERFFQEARLAALLSHPNIVQTYELVEQDGDTLLAMEAVHGADVAVVLRVLRDRGRAMPVRIALFIAASIADALAYAHDKQGPDGQALGLIHRDVTPSNVLISVDGVPKLIDFGIAKAATSSSPQTQAGLVLGKAWYLSPEQCVGKPIDGKSDVFALGVVLFQMLAGRVPFGGRNGVSAMEKIASGRRPALSALVPDVPKVVEAVVDAALTVDADRRPTAKALRTLIERALATVDPERLARDEVADLLRSCLASGSVGAEEPQGSAPTLLLMDLKHAAAQATDDDSDTATGDPVVSDRTSTHMMPVPAPPRRSRVRLVAASVVLLGAVVAVGAVLFLRADDEKLAGGGAPVISRDAGPAEATVSERSAAVEVALEGPLADVVEPEPKPKVRAPKKPKDKAVDVVEQPSGPARKAKPVKIDGSGKLTIHSEPWAQVWLGGKSLGMTWAGNIEVPAGKHTLFLKNPVTGHEKTINVDIRPGSIQVLNINLDRARKAPNH